LFRGCFALMEEYITVVKRPTRDLSVCLLYPNEYRGMVSNVGFHIVYRMLAEAGFNVDRAYLPTDSYDLFSPERRLVTLETGSAPSKFDVVDVSLQFELDYPHVLEALVMGGIPPRREDRGDDDPIVMAGGPCTVNPEPMSPFIDAFYVGEAEAHLLEGLEVIERSSTREEALENLAEIPGFYVPAVGGTVERVHVEDLDSHDPRPAFHPSDPSASGLKAYPVEIQRGCPYRCRFCMGGWTSGPPRFRSLESVEKVLDDAIGSPYDTVALIGPSPLDHPEFWDIVEKVKERGLRLSVPSLRVSTLDAETVKGLASAGVGTLTLAVESGHPGIREFLGKDVPMDLLRETVETAADLRLDVKLYLIIGVPGFDPREEVKANVELVRELKRLNPRIRVSVNPLVPKAHTPFQFLPMTDLETLTFILKELDRKIPAPVSVEDPLDAGIQCVLSRGGKETSEIPEKLAWNVGNRGLKRDLLRRFDPTEAPSSPEELPYRHVKVPGVPEPIRSLPRRA